MLPLGVLAASGGSVPIALEQISTTLITTNTSSVTFNSIPQTYKHLQIRWTGRNSISWGSDGTAPLLWYRINGSSASSYSTHQVNGNGSSVSTGANSSLDYIRFSNSLANSFSPSNAFGAGIADFLDYTNPNTNKTLRSFAGYVSSSPEIGGLSFGSGALNTNGAITSITIGAGNGPSGGGTFVSGSRFTLYGIRG